MWLTGYDRRRCMRRTRIDSIPEEQTDEEDEEDDNDKQGVSGLQPLVHWLTQARRRSYAIPRYRAGIDDYRIG